jgi:glucose 1-dehydrogenase
VNYFYKNMSVPTVRNINPFPYREISMQLSLANQIAVVTGGDSGIGHAIAVTFAEAGAKVVVNFRTAVEKADAVVKEIAARGGQAIAVKGDVGDEHQVDRIFKKAIEVFGAVDILVANAGMQRDAAFGDMTIDQWDDVLRTNLTGQFLCARAALKTFRTQGNRGVSTSLGKILCMSSVHQAIPWSGHANYAASKGGVAMLMQTLAQEVAGEGIRVNAISPGAIRTPINASATTGEAAERLMQLIPSGRIGAPVDVARAALFLASDMADYIVGATLVVDGGMMLYPGFEDNG